MDLSDRLGAYFREVEDRHLPQLSVNCVIFGFGNRKLQVVVNNIDLPGLKMQLLPGGFIEKQEDIEVAVRRVVKESTGLEKILFRQFAVFGAADRSYGRELKVDSSSLNKWETKAIEWLTKRFVTVCYLALVDLEKIELAPTLFLDAAQWLPVSEARKLSMDHAKIVESARQSLIKELPYTPVASNLLSAKFTLPELLALYEAILDRPIDRPNFRRKMLGSGLIVKVGVDDKRKGRPADLYQFKHGKKTSLNDELTLGF